jgi:hypothetical protein
MKIDDFKKLEKKINNSNFNESYKTINLVLVILSWFGHFASIFLAYFMLSKVLSGAMTDNPVAVFIASIIILSGLELLKRDIFDKFSIQYLKLKSIQKVLPLFILSISIIGISFYSSINGASEFASKEKELETDKELVLKKYNDSLKVINDSLIKSKDLEIFTLKSKLDIKDKEQTEIESQQPLSRQQRQRVTDLKTERTTLRTDIDKIETDKKTLNQEFQTKVSDKEKELGSKTDEQKKDNSKNTVAFVIISTLIELIILAGVYFNEYYKFRSYREFRNKLEKDPNFQKYLIYEQILQVIYPEDTKMNQKLPSNKGIIDTCKVNDLIILNKDLVDFFKIVTNLGIVKVGGSVKYINKQRDLSFEILQKHFGVE